LRKHSVSIAEDTEDAEKKPSQNELCDLRDLRDLCVEAFFSILLKFKALPL
jgi:hypothetical protein